MIYLIGQLSIWLLLTALFAAIAGWAMAAERAQPGEHALRRDRENLLRDLARLASGAEPQSTQEGERESDAARRLLEIRDGRIAELEAALSLARGRAEDALGRIAELERQGERPPAENEELIRLRALAAAHEQERASAVEVEATPAPDDGARELQGWRLRYFEQRVRYLEGLASAPPQEPVALAPPAPAEEKAPPLEQWRARDAEARAAYLGDELRALLAQREEAPAQLEEAPEPAFAANVDVDMLLRWRLLYLEKRVAHLQDEAVMAPAAPQPELEPTPEPEATAAPGPDPDRWRWRARYLEARVRHLESLAAQPAPAASAQLEAPAPAAPPPRAEKPPVLPAPRHGAPDDFTLIEDVSAMQQSTLYSIGVFHFDQIAAWTPGHVAWVDRYLRLRGRIEAEEWVEQARELAREGVTAARRMAIEEDA